MFKETFIFFLSPSKPPRSTPAPESCVSSRKRRSFEVPRRGGFQQGRGRWGGKKRKKDAQKVLRNSLDGKIVKPVRSCRGLLS